MTLLNRKEIYNKKLVVRIAGGLGNQLFQYAAARRMALKKGLLLKLDVISGYERDLFKRSFSLNNFNIKVEIATPAESYAGNSGCYLRFVKRKLDRLKKLSKRKFIQEDNFGSIEDFLDTPLNSNIYIEGYLQSEKYFKDIEAIIRDDLQIKAPMSAEVLQMGERIIAQPEAVCLHVRRLYRLDSTVEDKSCMIDLEYYANALDYIRQKTVSPYFFVFSDDIEWTKKNIDVGCKVIYVDRDISGKDYEILYLMSQCRHFISSFSTFSWWGSWLGNMPDKIVCTNIGKYSKWSNIVPKGWIEF
jgi:Glycosyl transferase family 11